jgi:histidine ammonia-lyase
MIEQYTAAALVSENKVLIHPASGDSIPTSANQEDHVSMGTIAARQTRQILRNVERVLAIEIHCAYEALGFRSQQPGVGTRKALSLLRGEILPLRGDRPLSQDIDHIVELIHADAFSGLLED